MLNRKNYIKNDASAKELREHKYIYQFLSIFGFKNWDDAKGKAITSDYLKEIGSLKMFETYGLKYKLRDIFFVQNILKLKKSEIIDSEEDLITLLRTVSRVLGMKVRTETEVITIRKKTFYVES